MNFTFVKGAQPSSASCYDRCCLSHSRMIINKTVNGWIHFSPWINHVCFLFTNVPSLQSFQRQSPRSLWALAEDKRNAESSAWALMVYDKIKNLATQIIDGKGLLRARSSPQRSTSNPDDVPNELSQIVSIKSRASGNDLAERRTIPRLSFLKTFLASKVARQVSGVIVMAAGHGWNLSYGCMGIQGAG